MTLLLNRELVSRAKLCLVSVFPHIVKDYPKIRNLPKIFLRSFRETVRRFCKRLSAIAVFGDGVASTFFRLKSNLEPYVMSRFATAARQGSAINPLL